MQAVVKGGEWTSAANATRTTKMTTFDAARYVDSESDAASEKKSKSGGVVDVAAPAREEEEKGTSQKALAQVDGDARNVAAAAAAASAKSATSVAVAPVEGKANARSTLTDLVPEGVWRNLAILWGACLGALYEVCTMPTTVSNFNKAVYATTGYLGEYLPKGYSGALSLVDFYAMVADAVSTIVFFCLNVVTAIAMVLVTVRVIALVTGYGESALNFVCIPFTWTYALKAVKEVARDFKWSLGTHEVYGTALGVTVVTVEAFEMVAPVTTRGLCLGVCFSLFAADILRFSAGFLWVLGLLIATWTARGVLRMILRIVARVCPPVKQLTHALPRVVLVPGLKAAGAGLMSGAKASASLAGKGAKAAGAVGAKAAGAAGKGLKAGAGAAGSAAKRGAGGLKSGIGGAAGAAGVGAKVGTAAAKGTLVGVMAGTRGGVAAGLAAGKIGVRGTILAGKIAANAPGYAWRSAGRIRSFVKLTALRAEATLDPVAPKTKATLKKNGGLGGGAAGDKKAGDKDKARAVASQRLKLN